MPRPIPCPSKAELVDCLLGKLPDARSQQLLDHASECATCSQWMDEADGTSDGLVASLRVEHPSTIGSDIQCERMIQRAEQLVPSNPIPSPPVEPKSHLLEGTRVRDYEIVRPIGEGGMGAVFLARHVRLKREVAVKVLSLGRQNSSEAQRRFEQEMQIVGQLQHPGIVQALDAGEDHGIQYLVMEVISGADLRRIVRLVGPLELGDACEITYQTAKALEYAHSQKLVHRDIKPSNIMISREGVVKVMDLGIARFADQQHALTSTQQALGSLDFMAPEQLQAQNTDSRADVFALGCTLHFLLTGEPPERRRTASLLVSKAPKLEGLRHTLPPPLTHLLQQMLLPNPAERCESMADVADRIKPFCGSADLAQLAAKSSTLVEQEDRGEAVSPTSDVRTIAPRPGRRQLWMIAGLCAIGLAATLYWFPRRSEKVVEPTGLASLSSVSSNIEPIREVPLFQIHKAAIRCLAYCESTSQLIVGSDDRSISIRDLPNQKRINCLFASDAPIKKLAVANHSKRFVTLDETAQLMAFDLPEGTLAWSKMVKTSDTPPADLLVTEDDRIVLRDPDGNMRTFRMADGASVARIDDLQIGDFSVAEFERNVEAVAARFNISKDEIDQCRQLTGPSRLPAWVVSRDRLAWLLDGDSPQASRTFIYAEHEAPITALLTFASESMVLTADAAGKIRLWQAPNTRYSDMLLGCATKIDSMEMTFALRQNRWTAEAFSASPDQVQMDDHGGEMRLKTTIERDTLEHTLQYKVVSP